MADFPVFPIEEREPNIEHVSDSTTIPANLIETRVQVEWVGIDMVAEPDTTVFNYSIQKRPNASAEWAIWTSGVLKGQSGRLPPAGRSVTIFTMGIPEILKGQQIRGVIAFVSAGNIQKTWGVVARFL